MDQDVSAQLLEQVRASEYFALQLDESTDVSNAAQLLMYIRLISQERFVEEILFCKALESRTNGRDKWERQVLDEYIESNGLDWCRCGGVFGRGHGHDWEEQWRNHAHQAESPECSCHTLHALP